MARRMNKRRRAFIDFYMTGGGNPRLQFNATRAALAAGYSPRSARDTGVEILKNPDVEAEISRRMSERVMNADQALTLLSDQAFFDLDDVMTMPGTFPYFDYEKARRKGKTKLIKKLKVRGDGGIEVEFIDPQKALETILKHHGLLKEGSTFHFNLKLILETASALEGAGVDVDSFMERARQEAERRAAVKRE